MDTKFNRSNKSSWIEILKKLIINYNVIGISRSASKLISIFKKSLQRYLFTFRYRFRREEISKIISQIKEKQLNLLVSLEV